MLQPVKDHQDFAKDCNTGSVVNTNVTAFQEHLRKKEQARRIDVMETKLDNIERMLEELLKKS